MIELKHLTKQYGKKFAVRDVSLQIGKGELLVLLGGSGSGKTTILKMINRLIEPSAGSVLVDGRDTTELASHELRRQVGYVFQQVGLFPHMTVAENIGLTPALIGWTDVKIRRRVDELLLLVELNPNEIRDQRPHQLSGGQQQRVGVARALAAKPNLMLLDEPFGAVDPPTRKRLQESFIQIRRELHLTAIFVTHDMVEALVMGDRIAIMEAGRLVQIGKPDTLIRKPANEYVRQLLDTPRHEARRVESLLAQKQGS